MVDSQRNKNSLMKRILKTITSGCFGGQEERASLQEQKQQPTHCSGKEPAGSSAGGEGRIMQNVSHWEGKTKGVGTKSNVENRWTIGAIAPELPKRGHPGIRPLLLFCAISCIHYEIW
ncbi:hypothetical protein Bca101_043551 [Brassica carinata]